jgi:dephospho-CoA kinase
LKPAFLSVGLTGGVGSGKSTVAAMLQQLGAGIVDADELAHALTAAGGAAIEPLRARFGEAAIAADGALDRAQMRAYAFEDRAARRDLEGILHPMIRSLARERGALLAATGSPYVVYVIPLLVESGNWRDRVHRVLVVDCSEAAQIARATARPGIDERAARGIIAAQATRAERLAAADDVLFNEAPLEELRARVRRLHEAYLKLVAGIGAEAL